MRMRFIARWRSTAVSTPVEVRQEMVDSIRRFVEREVVPVASEFDHRNEYPH